MTVINSHVPTITQFLNKLVPGKITEVNNKCLSLVKRVSSQKLVRGYGTKVIDQNTGNTLISVYVSETTKTAYCRIVVENNDYENLTRLEVVGKSETYEGAIETALQLCFDKDCNPVNGITTLANVYYPDRQMIEIRF